MTGLPANKIVQLNEEVIKGQIKELVRDSVEEILNELLEAEAEKLTQAARYDRNLITTSGNVTLHVPRLKGVSFAVIHVTFLSAIVKHLLVLPAIWKYFLKLSLTIRTRRFCRKSGDF